MNVAELRSQVLAIGRESWLLFLALSTVNASNYVFHVAVSGWLGPEDYGALGSVLAILTVLSVPISAIQAAVARRVASGSVGADYWRQLLIALLPKTAGIAAILMLISPLLIAPLRLDSPLTGIWVSAYIVPAVAASVLRGALQGQMRFGALATTSVVPVIARLAIGLAWVSAGGGVTAAVAASVISDFIGVFVCLAFLGRQQAVERAESVSLRRFGAEVVPVAVSLAALWALIEVDLILARPLLAPAEAGNYAAAGLLGRAVLFVPGAIAMIALPHFSRFGGRGREAFKWLVAYASVISVLGLATVLVLLAAGDQIVSLTYGDSYRKAADLLPVVAGAMAALGLVNLLTYFHIAAGSRVPALLLVATAIEAVALAFADVPAYPMAFIVLCFSWAVAVLGFVATKRMALMLPGMTSFPADLEIHRALEAPQDDGAPELSLVIPCHKVGTQLISNVAAVIDEVERLEISFEVIVVSDGSAKSVDSSLVRLDGPITVLHYSRRQGKGMALRVGMSQTRGRFVAFIDSDGELDPAGFKNFLALMELYGPDLVIGSKRHPLSEVQYPLGRRVMSWMYHRLVLVLFGVNVRDTQTGMKLIRRDVLDSVLPRMLEKRFAFDLELLVVARRLGFKRVFEAPVRLNYKFASTVAWRDVINILLDTAAIFYRRYIVRYYDHGHDGTRQELDRSMVVDGPAESDRRVAVQAGSLDR